MADLVGLDGRPIDDVNDVLVPGGPDDYLDRLGERGGFSKEQRDFLRSNLPTVNDPEPDHMSRSQRQIAALKQAALKMAMDNMQLWAIIGAAIDAGGGVLIFTQAQLQKHARPPWPVVVADHENNLRIALADAATEEFGITNTQTEAP